LIHKEVSPMKNLIFALTIAISFWACNSAQSPAPPADNPATRIELFDTTGAPSATFHAGEDFDVRFSLRNTTGRDRLYYFTGVPVVFTVYQADSAVATSIDGMVFPQVVLGDTVFMNEEYHNTWRAPNPLLYRSGRSLPPGDYQIGVRHQPFFYDYPVPPSGRVAFRVIP
jgi:hypothetical protein